jgi:hypothetical protein
MLILITLFILSTYILFDKHCKQEWANEDVDLLITEGTGHD